MGRAVTAQDIPTPKTNCQGRAPRPIQSSGDPCKASIPIATKPPAIRGANRASPAVIPVSLRRAQTSPISNSTPAIQTKSITAHEAMPVRSWTTGLLKTNSWTAGNHAPRTPGPRRMPQTI